MTNQAFTNQLQEKRNEIINFISEQTNDSFIFNFLTNKEKIGKMKIGSREQWSGAHCRVQPFSKDKSSTQFNHYANPKGYYITFNTLGMFAENNGEFLSFSIRTDLITFWGKQDTSNLYIMVVSNLDDKIYEIPVKKLISFILQETKKDPKVAQVRVLNKESAYPNFTIELSDEIISYESKQNHNIYQGIYNTDYYKPEYIANFVYAKYRCKNAVKVYAYDSKTMKPTGNKVYRSIKELFDELTKRKLYDKTYKTLQREVAKESMINLEKVVIIATTDLEKDPVLFAVEEVVDETMPNPFFNEYDEEGPCNPKRLITKSHYESKELDPTTDEYKQKFEEEYHCDEIEQVLQSLENQWSKEKQNEMIAFYEKSLIEDKSDIIIYNEIKGEYDNYLHFKDEQQSEPLF